MITLLKNYIKITDSLEDHWRDVSEENNKDMSRINDMRWDLYTK